MPSPADAAHTIGPATHSGKSRWRPELVCEVCLWTAALVLGVGRLRALPLVQSATPPIATVPIVLLAVVMPIVALRPSAKRKPFMFPFTDERGYRDTATADEGLACALALPVALAAAFVWDARSPADSRLPGIRFLQDIWRARGLEAPSDMPLPSAADAHELMLRARVSLLYLATANAWLLLVHLLLARTVLRIERLPQDNTKRFFGLATVAGTISAALWVGAHITRATGYCVQTRVSMTLTG